MGIAVMFRRPICIVSIVVALLSVATTGHAIRTILDDFTSTGELSSGNWTDMAGGITGVTCYATGSVVQANASGAVCEAIWNANSYSGDQSASITISSLTDDSVLTLVGVLLKGDPAGGRNYYSCRVIRYPGDAYTTRITKYSPGPSVITDVTDVTWTAGDILSCGVTGTTTLSFTLYKNGLSVLTGSDSSSPHSGDYIGVTLWGNDDVTHAEGDNFAAGIESGAPPSATRKRTVMVE